MSGCPMKGMWGAVFQMERFLNLSYLLMIMLNSASRALMPHAILFTNPALPAHPPLDWQTQAHVARSKPLCGLRHYLGHRKRAL